jgi:uncharacterized membrane protein
MNAPRFATHATLGMRLTTRRAVGRALLGGMVGGLLPTTPTRAAPAAQSVDAALPRYAIADLDTGSGNAGRAWLISPEGVIVGDQARFTNGVVDPASIRLVLWRSAATIDLTALGITAVHWFDAAGDVIAQQGDAVVRYAVGAGTIEPAPDAVPTLAPPAGFVRLVVAARNGRGELAGAVFPHADDDAGARGFIQTAQGLTVLPPVAGGDTSVAGDLSNAGFVVGGPAADGALIRPGLGFRYDLVAGTTIVLSPLPNYEGAAAAGVNGQGMVVGAAHHPTPAAPTPLTACLWPAGATTPIALQSLLPAEENWRCRAAYDLNDAGILVGSGWEGDDPLVRPFVMHPAS